MVLGGCREWGAELLLPSLPFSLFFAFPLCFSFAFLFFPCLAFLPLPFPSLPRALAGSQGCWVLAWGPSPAHPAPSPHPWEAQEPVLPLRCGPWPAGSRPAASLGRRGGKGSKASRGGWQHQHPFLGLSLLHRGFPGSFFFFLLVSGMAGLFSAEEAPACPTPSPVPQAHLCPSLCSLSWIKAPLPVLQTLFSSEIRSSPAALY